MMIVLPKICLLSIFLCACIVAGVRTGKRFKLTESNPSPVPLSIPAGLPEDLIASEILENGSIWDVVQLASLSQGVRSQVERKLPGFLEYVKPLLNKKECGAGIFGKNVRFEWREEKPNFNLVPLLKLPRISGHINEIARCLQHVMMSSARADFVFLDTHNADVKPHQRRFQANLALKMGQDFIFAGDDEELALQMLNVIRGYTISRRDVILAISQANGPMKWELWDSLESIPQKVISALVKTALEYRDVDLLYFLSEHYPHQIEFLKSAFAQLSRFPSNRMLNELMSFATDGISFENEEHGIRFLVTTATSIMIRENAPETLIFHLLDYVNNVPPKHVLTILRSACFHHRLNLYQKLQDRFDPQREGKSFDPQELWSRLSEDRHFVARKMILESYPYQLSTWLVSTDILSQTSLAVQLIILRKDAAFFNTSLEDAIKRRFLEMDHNGNRLPNLKALISALDQIVIWTSYSRDSAFMPEYHNESIVYYNVISSLAKRFLSREMQDQYRTILSN